jgi:glycosyltransferase involved in cell wall biosynthesis
MGGSGALLEACKEQAARLLTPGSFYFPGFVPSYQSTPYYLASDIAFYPSRYDTWARGINEAMLCMRPCLATDRVAATGGLVDGKENGLVVNCLDTRVFSDRLIAFFKLSSDVRAEMGAAARRRALQYSYRANVEALHQSVTECAT